jgi:hypothetical protein
MLIHRIRLLFASAFLVLFSLFAALPVAGCSPAIAPMVVAGIADVANHGADPLLAAYKQAGEDALAKVHFTGDKATDDAATKAALAAVDKAWAPVWSAWDVLRAAELTYAAAYTRGEAPDFTAVVVAFCALRATLPEDHRPMVEAPLLLLGVSSKAVCP